MGRVNTRKPRRKTTKRTARSITPASPQSAVRATGVSPTHTGSGIVSPWGRVDEEYALIKADLKRLASITAFLLLVLVVLTYFLR